MTPAAKTAPPAAAVALALVAALAAPAPAQIVYDSDEGGWRVLESEDYLVTEDWPALRDDLLARWGGPGPETLPFDRQAPIGTPGLPAAYRAADDRAEILHLERPPADPSVWFDLADLFPDVTAGDLEAFREGARFEAISLLPGEVEVSVMFLGRAPGGGAGGGGTVDALAAALTAALPADPDAPDPGGAAPILFLRGGVEEARPIVADLLRARGFEVIAQPPSPDFAQVMAFDGTETVVVTITAPEPGSVQVLIGGG